MKTHINLFLIFFITFLSSCEVNKKQIGNPGHDLIFNSLANRWDEAIPQGNGILGTLIWQKGDNLRFSLDRADLWDLSPMHNLKSDKYKYKWVYNNWKNNTYKTVQDAFDNPYNKTAAPSKIPAAALEFNVKNWGEANSVHLSVNNALCEVKWPEGQKLLAFVDAKEPVGWFRFENVKDDITPILIPPAYGSAGDNENVDSHSGQDLRRLGYTTGKVNTDKNNITYEQEGWGGFKYLVHVTWEKTGGTIEGCWSISSEFHKWEKSSSAIETVKNHFPKGFEKSFKEHSEWWKGFWAKSSINIPDSILERQWYLEQYKFGSAARSNTPPISLQAV